MAETPGARPRRSEVPPQVLATLREVGADLYAQRLVTSHGGNLSIRDGSGLWITGTGTMLGRLESRHISRVQPDGSYEGPSPSTDTILHSTIYALSQAGAVVHAHPRHAIALSFGAESFQPPDFEGALHLGTVPVIENDAAAVARIASSLQESRVVILRAHGAYAAGDTLWEALHWLTALEESAEVAAIRERIPPPPGD